MVLEATRRLGIFVLILCLTFLVTLFSAWCGAQSPSMPNFPLIEEALKIMLAFGIAIGQVGAVVGIVFAPVSLFIPVKHEKKEEGNVS